VKLVLFYGMASHLFILFIFLAKDPRHLTLYAWARHHSPLVLSRLLHLALYFITCLLKMRVMLKNEGSIHCKQDIPQIDATQVKSIAHVSLGN
jgi:hypothetical protein